jgi:alpha-1,6-mannosyltransferase
MQHRQWAERLAWARRCREGRPWLTNVVLCLLGLGLCWLAHDFVAENGSFFIGFSGASGWSDWLFVAAAIVVLTQPVNKATFGIVIGFAIAFRAMTIFADPFLSSDIYRYVWDGVMQHAHINPYRYAPGDPVLMRFREPNQDLFDNINRRDYAHTIYPPVAQIIYWFATIFSPTVQAMKFAMLGFECAAVAGLVKLLGLMGRRREEVLLYAWCPLLVWEIGDAGHVDAAIIAFVVWAMVFRFRGRAVWTGVFLGAAVLTKFYPLVLFPALWMRRDWKMPAVMVAMAAGGYALYSSVGWGVFGFLGGYEKEEGMNTGTRYFAVDWAQQYWGLRWFGKQEFLVLCAVVMGGLCWWAWKRATVEVCSIRLHAQGERTKGASGAVTSPRFIKIAMCLAFAFMLLFSPHYPWYIAWLVPFLVLVPNVPLLAYVCTFFYLFTTALADGSPANMLTVNKWLYGVTLIACAVQWAWSRWRLGQWFVVHDDARADKPEALR